MVALESRVPVAIKCAIFYCCYCWYFAVTQEKSVVVGMFLQFVSSL